MAKQVLIIEDDEAIAKAIGEVCAGLGEVEVSIAKNGAAALEKASAQQFDLITLDILLPGGMDGYKVAEGIRERDAQVPVVVISGFVKDPKVQKTLQSTHQVRAVLQKPCKPEEIRAALGPALGLRTVSGNLPAVPAPGAAARGTGKLGPFQLDLAHVPPAALFGELYRQKAEGVLDLVRGGTKKRFYLQRGFFRYATSNVRGETLPGILAAKGVPEKKIQAAMQRAKDEGLGLTDALVTSKVIAERDVAALLATQTEEVAVTALVWTDGQASFRPAAVDSGPEGRANPVMCVLKGLKRLVPPAQARGELQRQAQGSPERTPELDRELFAIRNLFQGESVTPALNGKSTVGDLLGRAKDVDVQLLHAVLASGLARPRGEPPLDLSAFTSAGARPTTTPNVPLAAVPRPVSGVRRRYTADEEANREQIFTEKKRLDGVSTHYQVLGLSQGADAQAVKNAYFRLARTWHADAFAGMELGDAAPALEEIFRRVSEAYQVLSDAEERTTYDHILSQQAKGIPTDPEQILQAETTFSRGESARKAGRLRDAEKLYREAVGLYPANAAYLFALANAVQQLQGKAGAREAAELLDKALAIKQDLLEALLLRGQLHLDGGQPQKALELARKITGISAGYPGAMELLRTAKAALQSGGSEASEKGGGLFGRLFGGKGK